MADSTADAAAKKPTLSSRLLQMKFMQRGKEKIVLKDAIAEQASHIGRHHFSLAPHALISGPVGTLQ